MSNRSPGLSWWLLALFASAVGGYGVLMIDARQVQDAVPGFPWLDELHFVASGLALILGVWGFRRDLLAKRKDLHRRIGKLYMVLVLLGGVSGAAMACYSMHGMVTHLGFGLLAIVWLIATFLGWHRIHKRKDVIAHRRWMVRSYALTCAAISLRVQLGPLAMLLEGFEPAYKIVSWSAWIPNVLFAEWWLRRHPNP